MLDANIGATCSYGILTTQVLQTSSLISINLRYSKGKLVFSKIYHSEKEICREADRRHGQTESTLAADKVGELS
jgi:hypothetical protein